MSLSWLDVERLVEDLAAKINSRPDAVVGVARGGLIPAVMLAHQLGVPLVAAIGVRFTDESRTVIDSYAEPGLRIAGQVLLVEDAVNTGRLLAAAADLLRAQGHDVTTAALLRCRFTTPVDVVAREVATIPRMPWES